jgi:hypothetical protein
MVAAAKQVEVVEQMVEVVNIEALTPAFFE